MKRLEIVIPSSRLGLVVSEIEGLVGGMTIGEARGRGKGTRPSLRSFRGTSTQQAEYNTMSTIITIVDDSRVDAIVDAVLSVASTGSAGDGKIFISSVDETVDIQTKRRGAEP